MYETTARRDGIAVHEKSYYKKLLEQSGDTQNEHTPRVTLYIAEYNGEPLAAIITVFLQREAIYLYGASSNSHRNLMPAYLLQWIAVCDAKTYGSAVYDFYGIPPNDNENHPMHGLYRFKTGFGGKIIHRPGSIDVPLSPFYILYIAAERIRAFWFKKIKKLFLPAVRFFRPGFFPAAASRPFPSAGLLGAPTRGNPTAKDAPRGDTPWGTSAGPCSSG